MQAIVRCLPRRLSASVRLPTHFALAEQPRWQPRRHHSREIPEGAETVRFVFAGGDGDKRIEVVGAVGENLLDIAHRHDVEMEGACEGSCACSTCHVILEDDVFDGLPEASEEEDDMLDMAPGLTENSRLGCQVEVDSSMEGMVVQLPNITRNFYVDGAKPSTH